ncbi:hypothetical protein Pan44_37190 [Caulifigura coniformis]|uniref:Uncharacterized protein n=1 Tax=Caulifigura coniformis TaxID=2527983 RepID=A0A517SHS4_9PLAN|nr:hypothetical protein Pan44_37190 [Caulifigura coniformis]
MRGIDCGRTMILSLWLWSRKHAGRRSLISVSGVLPFLLVLPVVLLVLWSIVGRLL